MEVVKIKRESVLMNTIMARKGIIMIEMREVEVGKNTKKIKIEKIKNIKEIMIENLVLMRDNTTETMDDCLLMEYYEIDLMMNGSK